ncbi:MAG: hypothetical protein ACXWYM_00345 [Candidatus Binatia bacterium]
MANTDAAYGFKPRSLHGSDPALNTHAPRGYAIASGYGTSIFTGDPVKSTGTASADGRPDIEIAPAGAVRGVFAGCEYTNAAGEQVFSKYWPASTAATNIIAHVYDHPDTIFSIQADEDIVIGDIGNKVDFISGTGNTTTGQSAYELDSSNITTGDALLILGSDDMFVPNNLAENFTKVLVKFREHELGATLTAV